MRLIDADWVFAHLKPYEPSDEKWGVTGGTALRLIHNAIDNAPTVDAMSVVRCKDCTFSHLDGWFCGGVGIMPEHQTLPDSFCDNGMRKDDTDSATN